MGKTKSKNRKSLTELSLFTGGGGGLIATSLFMGFKTIGMVEWNEHNQKILQARQKDNLLDQCPMFSDIDKFISEGFAEAYKGITDIVTGGFPCQAFAMSGKRKNKADPRNKFPETAEVIRIIRPRFFFLENVANLLSFQYAHEIFGTLSEIGYDIKWQVVSAQNVGALHKRERVWIFGERRN